MRYQFVGKPIPGCGKTLWEILGNLKDFGVGRYVIKTPQPHPSCFFKIIKVQPKPPPKNQFEPRNVMVWIQEFHIGVTLEQKVTEENNDLAVFQLIPKINEKSYLDMHEECSKKIVVKTVPGSISCPPLFKEIWEKHYKEITNTVKLIPKIESGLSKHSIFPVKEDENIEEQPPTCDLYKKNVSVEELIKEVVRLKKIIKSQEM